MTPAVVFVALGDVGPGASRVQMRAHKARMLDALWRRMGQEPQAVLSRTRAGRPRCAREGFDISTAHDRGLVGVAVGSVRVGLDVMRWRAVPPSVSAWLNVLPHLAGQPRGSGEGAHVVEWTRLEAVIKYLGGSVLREWSLTTVGTKPSSVCRFVGAGGKVNSWHLPEGAVSLARWKPSHVFVLAPPTGAVRHPVTLPISHHSSQTAAPEGAHP